MYNLIFMLMFVVAICWLCRRLAAVLGQPEFVGDILTGVVITPQFLGKYLTVVLTGADVLVWVDLLRGLSEIGLVWILIDVVWCSSSFHGESLKKKSTAIIAIFSISVPFFVGAVLGYYSGDDLASGYPVVGYLLFCGIALSVTALPVLAIIIDRYKFINKAVGGAALAAAIYTDVFAWISLALVVGVWGSSNESDASMVLRFFGLLSIFLGFLTIRWLVSIFNVKVIEGRPGVVLGLFLLVMMCATVSHGLGFHYSIGAIAAILSLARIRGLRCAWMQWSGNLRSVMVPVFFIGTGTMLNFSGLHEEKFWHWFMFFLIAGVASKVISSFFAGLLVGMRQNESLELGVLMATKGTAELVVLTVGLNASLLSDNSYMVLLLLSVVSTLLTAPLIFLLNKFQEGGRGRLKDFIKK